MNKKLYITLFIISIVFLSIGGTFALITNNINGINITQIKSGNLTLSIDGGGSINTSLVPAKCTSENAIKKKIVAKATNTSGGKVSFSLGLDITSISDSFKRNTMRYMLTTNENSCSTGIISGGNFKDRNTNDEVWLVKNDYDNITKSGNTYTKTYYLYIWLDEYETEYIEGNISVKIKGKTSNEPNLPIDAGYNDDSNTNTLYYQIKSNADTTTRIDFSKQIDDYEKSDYSTNGIYTTTNTENGVPVYYYRGVVDNNYVLFANFCWRIIRTTETGGVKLIYSEPSSTGEDCVSNNYMDVDGGATPFNRDNYPGYMYNDLYEISAARVTNKKGSIIFGNDVTYNASTNQYTLKDTYTLTDASNWPNEYITISNKYRYTCFTSSAVCTSVNYIYSAGNYDTLSFVLVDGANLSDVYEATIGVNSNVYDSDAKSLIDAWYENNLYDYSSMLEDTVFCSDLSNDDISYFSSFSRVINKEPSLVCPRQVDKFTMNSNNGNGALTYPVGMLTADETFYARMIYGSWNSKSYLNYLYNIWTMSPATLVTNIISTQDGGINALNLDDTGYAFVPVISLKAGTILSSGDGTSSSPYMVEDIVE